MKLKSWCVFLKERMIKMAKKFETVPQVWHPLKRVRLRSKPDCVMQLNCRWVHAYASCETTSNNRKLQSSRSIKNASPFRQTMAAYICSSSYFVVNLETESVYVSFSITWYTISDSKFHKNIIIYKSYSLLTYLGTNSYQ